MQIVLIIHSLLRWAVILFGLLAIIKAIKGYSQKEIYTGGDNKTSLFFMISCDIQFLIGLALYFGNSWFDKIKVPGSMKIAATRFFSMEHASMMIIAWILVHAGRVMVKKSMTDSVKHKKTLIFFGLALLLILAAIPWPFREAISRPLLRGFN